MKCVGYVALGIMIAKLRKNQDTERLFASMRAACHDGMDVNRRISCGRTAMHLVVLLPEVLTFNVLRSGFYARWLEFRRRRDVVVELFWGRV